MTTRSALVAATESHEGPWQRSQGKETGIIVRGLEEGGAVRLDTQVGDITRFLHMYADGQYNFPSPTTRWRAVKVAGIQPKETFVQVVLGEPHNTDSES